MHPFLPPPLLSDLWIGNQYRDTGWFGILFVLTIVVFIIVNIQRAKSGRELFIRRIGGLNAIDEAIGRATEMGKPVLMVPGLSDNLNAIVVQAMNIFSYVTKTAAKFANPILLCCYNAAILTVAQEMIRDVYQQEGYSDRYDPDSVRFISDRQFAFAAGVSGLILREQTAATFFLGEFYAESLIFAETANSIGAIQVASSTEVTQTPFFIAACDYVLIGDEFYAASAYLTRQPILLGSLIGQDWGKILVASTIILGVLSVSMERRDQAYEFSWKDGKLETGKAHPRKQGETTMDHFLNPKTDFYDPDIPSIKLGGADKRPEIPQDERPIKTGGGAN